MLRKLIQSIREYKKETILAPLTVILEVVLDVIIPLLLARLIDQGIMMSDMNAIIRIGFELLVAAFISLFGKRISHYIGRKIVYGKQKKI